MLALPFCTEAIEIPTSCSPPKAWLPGLRLGYRHPGSFLWGGTRVLHLSTAGEGASPTHPQGRCLWALCGLEKWVGDSESSDPSLRRPLRRYSPEMALSGFSQHLNWNQIGKADAWRCKGHSEIYSPPSRMGWTWTHHAGKKGSVGTVLQAGGRLLQEHGLNTAPLPSPNSFRINHVGSFVNSGLAPTPKIWSWECTCMCMCACAWV